MLFSPDILIIMEVTNSHRAYYYMKQFRGETISQQYKMVYRSELSETNATAKYTIRFLRDI
jgi:hypothetical protein